MQPPPMIMCQSGRHAASSIEAIEASLERRVDQERVDIVTVDELTAKRSIDISRRTPLVKPRLDDLHWIGKPSL